MERDIEGSAGPWRQMGVQGIPIQAYRISKLEDTNWFAAKVPGSVYTALIEAGLLKEKEILANPEKFKGLSDRPSALAKDLFIITVKNFRLSDNYPEPPTGRQKTTAITSQQSEVTESDKSLITIPQFF
jgi:hypothetical protein